MMKEDLKRFITASMPLFFIFSWYQIIAVILKNFLWNVNATYIHRVIVYSSYYCPLTLSSFVSTLCPFPKNKNEHLYLWFAVAIIDLVLYTLFGSSFEQVIILAVLGGIAFGMGFPFCFSFFAKRISIEERGRISGIVLFTTSFFLSIFALLSDYLEFRTLMIFSTCFMIIGFMISFMLRPSEIDSKKECSRSFVSIILNRHFLLYLVPWIIFCFIDTLEVPILREYLQHTYGTEFEVSLVDTYTVITAFSMLLGGFFADNFGRKKILIYSFIVLGMAYAVIGIAAQSSISWYIYFILYGIASGLFAVIYIFIIWGDLSMQGCIERSYVIGLLPYSVIVPISEFITPYVLLIPISATFSFASFFLFLAVFPLMYAPETLPEKLIRRRELRKYVEKAKRIREKYEKEKD